MLNDKSYRVLVVGYRSDLIKAIRKHGIPFALWDQKKRQIEDADPMLALPLSGSQDVLRTQAKKFLPYGPFSHVIACTESAVVAASIARRVLKARLSDESCIIECHDKLLMKRKLERCGIAMTPFLEPHQGISSEEMVAKLGKPVVLKDRSASGGRNIHFAQNVQEVEEHRKGRRIAERYVDALEYSVESFIHNGRIVFTNLTDYHIKKFVNILPAYLDRKNVELLLELNKAVIHCLKIRWGMTHMETYRTKDGYLFGEIALRPPGGYIMNLISYAYGFDCWDAFLAIELGEDFVFPQQASQYASVNIIHPGEGQVQSIQGLDDVMKLKSLVKISLKMKVGDILTKRVGVGEDYGYFIQVSPDCEKLLTDLQTARSLLEISL